MIKILILLIVLNCSKINISNFATISKSPMNKRLVDAIKSGDPNVIMQETNNLNANQLKELREGNKNFLMFLLQNYGINYVTPQDQIPRDLNADKQNLFDVFIRVLIDTLDETDSEGKTLLFYAIDTGIGEIVTRILDIPNVDLEHLNSQSISPLSYCILNKMDIFEYLDRTKIIVQNPNGNTQSNLNYLSKFKMSKNKKLIGTSPLITACCSKNQKAVKILLANGAEVNMENEKDTKAILLAAYNRNEKIVELLLAKGGKHLSRREISLRKFNLVMGTVMKAFLQKSIDAAITTAGRTQDLPIGGIPVSFDVNMIINKFDHADELDKAQCYKEVRRIYKKGNWLLHFHKEDINEDLIIEIGALMSEVLSEINKSYEKLMKFQKTYNKKGNKEGLKKIFAIKKFDENYLIGTDIQIKRKYALDIKSLSINHLLLFTSQIPFLDECLTGLKNEINVNIFDGRKANDAYERLNNLKDQKFNDYFIREGEIKSFYRLEFLFNEVVDAFKLLVGGNNNYKKLLEHLHNHFQKRSKIKESLVSFFENFKKIKKVWQKFEDRVKKIPKTNKVTKINSLFEETQYGTKNPRSKIYIRSQNNVEDTKDLSLIDPNDLNTLNIEMNLDHFDYFILKFRNLLKERDKLYNFIKRNIN